MAERIIFGRAAAERIKNAVIRIERMPYPSSQAASRYPILSGGFVLDAIAQTNINAANANTNTYGNGTAQPVIATQAINGTYNYTNHPAFPTPVRVINFSVTSGTIQSNTHIGIYAAQVINATQQTFGLGWSASGGLSYQEGIVTSTITTFNSNTNTYGQGSVQPIQPTVNANTNAATASNSGAPVTCYNFSINSGSITNGTHVGIMQRQTTGADTIWELVWAC